MKPPATRHKPLLLVDVDGVISLFDFEPDGRPPGRFENVEGIGHYLSAAAGGHLRRLADHFELTWCTGWQERANEHLVRALELPGHLPHIAFAGPPDAAGRHWKLDAIDAHAGRDRPLAWIDDDHAGCEQWARDRPGPTLLITTRPGIGMTDEHVHRLAAWARALAKSPPPAPGGG